MNLKQKTISGLTWSFIDSFSSQGIQFVVGIILARILSPREFGLVGMLTIFIAISQSIIDCGFSNALIRKKDCSQNDYSTTFYFNIGTSVFLLLVLYFCSGAISSFFKEPQLKPLIQVLGLGLLFNSFSIIQKTILIRELNFKLQMKISFIASLGSGLIALICAYSGMGVWSLVVLTLCRFGFNSFLLWIWSAWKPSGVFSKESFRTLFSFGSKLLLSGLIDTVYRNIYNLIIGKFFSAQQLGFYTQADQFQAIPSQNLVGVISKVSYPVLASIKDDKESLKMAYKRIIRTTMLVTFILMIGLAAISKALILVLIGEKWSQSVIYLQMLCFVGMFYPLHALNLNMLQVQGRSDLFLKLEIIKKIVAVPLIAATIFMGIKPMIIGLFINSLIAYILNSYWSGKLIGYSSLDQIRDILPSLLIAFLMGTIVFVFGEVIDTQWIIVLISQIILGALIVISLSEITRYDDYLYIKTTILNKLKGKNEKT